ncbi:hypothetical protein ACFQ4A_13625 [Lentibacillus salinarum]|uniref:MarR family transcriptional regulator n=2 Tax=Lentibacillus salinarum TaxID=446820 RepID=A0ABW3ZWQ1_9BACI
MKEFPKQKELFCQELVTHNVEDGEEMTKIYLKRKYECFFQHKEDGEVVFALYEDIDGNVHYKQIDYDTEKYSMKSQLFLMNLSNSIMRFSFKCELRDIMPKEPVNLAEVNEQEKNANEMGYGLYKIKDTNKAPFGQQNIENIDALNQHNYLSFTELGFLSAISPLIEMGSNAIIDPGTGKLLSITGIAKYLKKSRASISNTMNKLITKGIIFEITDANDLLKFNRSVSERPLLLNPEFSYRGDRNDIDLTLTKFLVSSDKIEEQKIYLPWKVWFSQNHNGGRLYRRQTYLKLRKETKGE